MSVSLELRDLYSAALAVGRGDGAYQTSIVMNLVTFSALCRRMG